MKKLKISAGFFAFAMVSISAYSFIFSVFATNTTNNAVLLQADFSEAEFDVASTWHLEGRGDARIDTGRLALQDTGVGIAEEHRDRVFAPLFCGRSRTSLRMCDCNLICPLATIAASACSLSVHKASKAKTFSQSSRRETAATIRTSKATSIPMAFQCIASFPTADTTRAATSAKTATLALSIMSSRIPSCKPAKYIAFKLKKRAGIFDCGWTTSSFTNGKTMVR